MRALPLLTLALVTTACSSRLDPQPETLPLDDVFRIELDATAARIDLVYGETIAIDGDYAWRNERTKPEVSYAVEDRILRISSLCARGWPRCGATHTLAVPDDVRVVVSLDQGQLFADGVGNLEVDARDASVRLDGLAGEATLRLVDSEVVGDRLATSALSLTTGGLAELTFAETGDSVQVTAGAAAIAVPSGAYRLQVRSDAGDTSVTDVFHEDTAPTLLDVETAGVLVLAGY